MSNVNELAAFLQQEPASSGTTGETDEALESQPEQEETEGYEPEESEGTEVEAEAEDLDDDQDPEDWHTVKVGGEEIQVTLDEALKGYQRDADYRKKTMAVAEERKAVDAEKERISTLVQNLESFIKNEQESIDWEALKSENPEQYIAKQEQLQKAEAARQEALAEQQSQYDAKLQTEIKALVEHMGGDEWSNEQRNTDMKLANEYLISKGFADADIGQLVDHRLWKVIFEAAKAEQFKQTETRVKEQVRKAPKSVKSGAKQNPSERKNREANNRLKNARNSREEVSALADLIKAKGN